MSCHLLRWVDPETGLCEHPDHDWIGLVTEEWDIAAGVAQRVLMEKLDRIRAETPWTVEEQDARRAELFREALDEAGIILSRRDR